MRIEDLVVGESRVEMVSMADDPDPIQTGDRGLVTGKRYVNLNGGYWQVDVDWDSGRRLSVCVPPDRIQRPTGWYPGPRIGSDAEPG